MPQRQIRRNGKLIDPKTGKPIRQSKPTGSPRSGSGKTASPPASTPKPPKPPAPKPPKPTGRTAEQMYGKSVVDDAVKRAVAETRKAAATKWLNVVGIGAEILRTGANIVNPNSESSQRISAAVGNVARAKAEADVARRNRSGQRQSQPNSGRPDSARERSQGVATSWQGPNPPRRPAPASPSPSPSPSPSGGRSSSGRSSSGGSSSGSSGSGGRTYSSSSPSTSTRSASSPAAKPETSKAGGAYGADGKQLYMAHKKNNPLMKRTFGYQTGEGPKKKDGDKGPVSGVGPVASGDKYAAKVGQNRGQKSTGGGGRAAMAGSKSTPVADQAKKEKSIMERIAEMKKRGMK